jgi:4-hydroxyphenylpyruvate dioxygenase-like putative hemolysin
VTVSQATHIAHHIGYAVRDATATAQRYEKMIGATFRLMPEYNVVDQYGKPARLKVYYGAMAGLAIEIIEVETGNTPHSDWIRQHGEGIQHLGVYVPDVVEAAKKAVANGGRIDWIIPQKGVVHINGGSTLEEVLSEVTPNSLVYIDAKEGGTIIELLGPPVHGMVFGNNLKGLEELIGTELPAVG